MRFIGVRIEERLSRGGYNRSNLAKIMRVAASNVSRWISGERTPNIEHLVQLEELLELNVLTKEFIKEYRKEKK